MARAKAKTKKPVKKAAAKTKKPVKKAAAKSNKPVKKAAANKPAPKKPAPKKKAAAKKPAVNKPTDAEAPGSAEPSAVEQRVSTLLQDYEDGNVDNAFDVIGDMYEMDQELPKSSALRPAFDKMYGEIQEICANV